MDLNGNNNIQKYLNNKLEDDTIDLKKIIFRFIHNWYWFLISIVVFFGMAFMYNMYKAPLYKIYSTLLVEEGNVNSVFGTGRGSDAGGLFQGLGVINSMRNINNQMEVLHSTPIIAKTLSELNFEVSYYLTGPLSATEIYDKVPFIVLWDENHPQVIDADFFVELLPSGKISLKMFEKGEVKVYSYTDDKVFQILPELIFDKEIEPGAQLISDHFSFSVFLNSKFNLNSSGNYKFRFNSQKALIKKYRTNLEASLLSKETSIIMLTLHEHDIQKGRTFLNKLIEVYQTDNLQKKNENANRIIQFINTQLQTISDSLIISENKKETFQSENQVLDLSMQSQQLLEQISELDRRRVDLETRNSYYKYLMNYIQDSRELETLIAPSAMGIEDPLLNNLILQLNDLITEKSSQTSIRKNSEHPIILKLNAQIESVKNSLQENTKNIISQSEMALNDINKRLRNFENQIRRLPATERNFVNIERKYKLNNETYTFLLQRLSEAQIAQASNMPESQILELPQMFGNGPVEPKKSMICIIALLLGLISPAGVILIGDMFSTKIIIQEDIENITNYPILGYVFNNQNKYSGSTFMLDRPNSPGSEPFRALRTKISLLTKEKKNPILAVTSTAPKEGKTYNAINIASSFALIKKRTILVDFDLRNSRMYEAFSFKSDLGIVNYIIGKAALNEIIYDTKHPYLKIIPAGPIPPNPGEMLNDLKISELLEQLKENFDTIILDTAPVGYVADLFHIYDLIDANLFIVRHKYTHKETLKNVLEELDRNKLKGVGLIINYIKPGKPGFGYGYGYSYGYKYSEGRQKPKRPEFNEDIKF